jgi:hypothetical protein
VRGSATTAAWSGVRGGLGVGRTGLRTCARAVLTLWGLGGIEVDLDRLAVRAAHGRVDRAAAVLHMAWSRAAQEDTELVVARANGVVDRVDAATGRLLHQYGAVGSGALVGVDVAASGCVTVGGGCMATQRPLTMSAPPNSSGFCARARQTGS